MLFYYDEHTYCNIFFFSHLDQLDLIVPIDNDDWLIRFLRPSKFYPESALELVSNLTFLF